MEPTPTMTIELKERNCHFIIEGMRDLREKWFHINRTTTDEDIQAEYGMDAIVLDMTCEWFEHAAVASFGQKVLNYAGTPYEWSMPPNQPNTAPPAQTEEKGSASGS